MGYRTTKSKIEAGSNKTSNYTDFFYYAFRNVLLISVPLLIFSIFVFTIPHSSAEISSGTDNIQLVLSTSCTVNAVVTSEHTVSLNGGQLDNNVGNTKLSAFCNDNNGYSIYAVGSSGDTDGNTDLVNTVNESYNIHTGVYNENNASNPSSWAMKLTAGTGTGIDPTTGGSVPTTPPTIINGFDNYSIIPNVYTQVAKRTSGTSMTTDTSVSGSYLDTTYQIYANSAQSAGTYNGKVKYVIVHPNNNNDYLGFNEVFALSGKSPAMTDGNKVYYAMQDMTTGICNQVGLYGEASQTQLVDIRDNNLYWIAKLADNNCWMTQNLDLYLIQNKTYTHADTDLGWSPNDFNVNASWTPTADLSWAQNKTAPYYVDPGDEYVYTSNSDADDTVYATLSSCTNAGHTDCQHYHIGNYYNWNAARADGNDNTSICPAGWRLPNLDSNEYGNLLVSYNIIQNNTSTTYLTDGFNNIRKAPLYFIRAGAKGDIAQSNIVPGTGNSRYFYGQTTTFAAYMNFSKTQVDPVSNNRYSQIRGYGYSIRCVAR